MLESLGGAIAEPWKDPVTGPLRETAEVLRRHQQGASKGTAAVPGRDTAAVLRKVHCCSVPEEHH